MTALLVLTLAILIGAAWARPPRPRRQRDTGRRA